MAELFQRDQSVIARHISNVFKEKELVKDSNMQIMHNTLSKYKPTTIYSLDAIIISVGYRVKSQRGTDFRKWANGVLKEYLLRGYVVTQQISEIRQTMAKQGREIAEIRNKVDFFVQTSLPPQQGIFFDGQVFDAYRFASDLIRKADRRIVLIDNYVDDTVLSLLDKRKEGVSATIYTKSITDQFQLDIKRHNEQYAPIEVRCFNKAHDRFLLIDDEVYHIGASIKDLGKKWFAFALMHDIIADDFIKMIK